MRFRTALLLGIAALILAMATAVVFAIKVVIDSSAQRDVREQLARTQDVFVELNDYRQSQLSAAARVLSDQPRLIALLETLDISPITVQGVARDLKRSLATERFLVADRDGRVLVDLGGDLAGASESRQSLQADHIVGRALAVGSSYGMWIQEGKLYQVLAQRIGFGDEALGVVVIGYRFDERMTESVYRLTGSAVLVELDGRFMTSMSLRSNGLELPVAPGGLSALAAALAPDPSVDAAAGSAAVAEPVEVTISGSKYLAIAAPFASNRRLRYVVLRSLERALAPGRKLQRVAYIAVGLALLLAFLLAFVVARRLSRPVDDLVAVTERIGGGDLQARAKLRGVVEIRTLSAAVNRMAESLDESRAELAAKQRIEQEMAIAARIQTAILPPAPLSAHGLDIAAHMIPATEVGGDYYDVLPADQQCWLAIGDVAGHGVPAGMIMMMVQNVIASMTRARPDATPSDIYCRVNRILVDHVRKRMQRDDHVTLTLLHHDGEGGVTFAGAHEDIVIWRADAGACEAVETPGTWLAVMDEIDEFITDQSLALTAGDIVVLYTDGVTEGMNREREQFGMDRLFQTVAERAKDGPDAVCQGVVDAVLAWTHERDDDITVLAFRYRPGAVTD